MNPPLDGAFDLFIARFRARLAVGAAHRGVSFERPCRDLVDEIQQEIEGVCGWSLLRWIRLDRLRGRVDELDRGGKDG